MRRRDPYAPCCNRKRRKSSSEILPCLNSLTFLANISVSSSLPHLGLGFGETGLDLTADAETLDFFISPYKMRLSNHIFFVDRGDIGSNYLGPRQYREGILFEALSNMAFMLTQ